MKNTKLYLYENLTANFRLSISTMYERTKPDGTIQQGVYINQAKETATFRVANFLVFEYLTDDYTTTKGVYTTIPHIYKIRQIFKRMADLLNDDASYVDVNGEKEISPNAANPLVIDGIGKNQDWISLSLTMCKDQTKVISYPAVAIQYSKSNGYSSLLTKDEFLSIYDIVDHLDFASLANQAVMIELQAGHSAPTNNSYNNNYNNNYKTTNSSNNYNKSNYRTPSFQFVNSQPVASSTNTTAALPPRSAAPVSSPAPTVNTAPAAKKIIMDPTAIDETDISDLGSLDDTEEVRNIFSDSDK